MLTALAAGIAAMIAPPAAQPVQGPAVTRLEASTADAATKPRIEGEDHALSRLPGDRMTVAVVVGPHGPYRFLVDTAADRSAISHQLASRLALPAGPEARLHSVTGESDVRTATVRGLRIATRTMPDINAPLLDEGHVGADGILGTDVLRASMVRFDFRNRRLSIAAPTRRLTADDAGTIVVEARRRSGRLIVTEAELDGQRLTVVLDTGSEVSIGNEALRVALSRRGRLTNEQPLTLTAVTGAQLHASFFQTRRLDVGAVTLHDLGIAFADVHTFRAMGIDDRPALLLGMNALQAFDSLTIDMAGKRLRFGLSPDGPRDRRFVEAGRPGVRS